MADVAAKVDKEKIKELVTTEINLEKQLENVQRQLLSLKQLPTEIENHLRIVSEQLQKIMELSGVQNGATVKEEKEEEEEERRGMLRLLFRARIGLNRYQIHFHSPPILFHFPLFLFLRRSLFLAVFRAGRASERVGGGERVGGRTGGGGGGNGGTGRDGVHGGYLVFCLFGRASEDRSA